MAALLLTTRATPLMYYGEEIGMRTTTPVRKEDVQDPIGKIGWPEEKGRDGERTPMQWDASKNAGFSSAERPWLPVPPSSAEYNVKAESQDPGSIWSFYKQLLALRRTKPALRDGRYLPVNREDPFVLAYLRKNPGSGRCDFRCAEHECGIKDGEVRSRCRRNQGRVLRRPLIAAPEMGHESTQLNHFTIPAFGVFIGSVH